MYLLALLNLFSGRNDRFPYPLIYLKSVKVALSGGASPYRLACSRRSDSGEQCEVKRSAKKIKAREEEIKTGSTGGPV